MTLTTPIANPRTRAFVAFALTALFLTSLVSLAGGSDATQTIGTRAGATPSASVKIVGHGWGHGRGLGQYGTLGYVRDKGWGRDQILGHYYSNTTSGTIPASHTPNPNGLRVELLFMSGRTTTVSLGQGTIELVASDGSVIASTVGQTNTVTLVPNGNALTARFGNGCQGPWQEAINLNSASVRVRANSEGTAQANLLQVCGPSFSVWYEGDIVSTISAGRQRTTNVVTVDQYLRGVVPNEMPALWPATALEVQAIAARSYVMAGDNRFSPVADTCDTTRCQVYDGRYTTRGGWRSSTHPATDRAVAATSGIVRTHANGKIARTEFSSSTGGHTAGGEFPAVPDAGDGVSSNPNSTWTVTVALSAIETKHGLGSIKEIAILKRNGLGRDGGRVEQAEYRFQNGSVAVSGNQVRLDLGLKSDWFTPGPILRGDQTAEPQPSVSEQEKLRQAANVEFVNRTYERLQGRKPTAAELSKWTDKVNDGSGKSALAVELVNSDHFGGVLVDDLYQAALGRKPDSAGRAYWIKAMKDGFAYEQVGVYFYGSDEYFTRVQRSDDRFVSSLYRNILGREPDPEGRQYWNGVLRTKADNVVVAESFYRSVESRRDRSRRLYRRVLGQSPSAEQVEGLASRLLEVSDLNLAAEIAVSGGSNG